MVHENESLKEAGGKKCLILERSFKEKDNDYQRSWPEVKMPYNFWEINGRAKRKRKACRATKERNPGGRKEEKDLNYREGLIQFRSAWVGREENCHKGEGGSQGYTKERGWKAIPPFEHG